MGVTLVAADADAEESCTDDHLAVRFGWWRGRVNVQDFLFGVEGFVGLVGAFDLFLGNFDHFEDAGKCGGEDGGVDVGGEDTDIGGNAFGEFGFTVNDL